MAPVINALLAGSRPRTKGYRVQCHLSLFLCLCYCSVQCTSAAVDGAVECIHVSSEFSSAENSDIGLARIQYVLHRNPS